MKWYLAALIALLLEESNQTLMVLGPLGNPAPQRLIPTNFKGKIVYYPRPTEVKNQAQNVQTHRGLPFIQKIDNPNANKLINVVRFSSPFRIARNGGGWKIIRENADSNQNNSQRIVFQNGVNLRGQALNNNREGSFQLISPFNPNIIRTQPISNNNVRKILLKFEVEPNNSYLNDVNNQRNIRVIQNNNNINQKISNNFRPINTQEIYQDTQNDQKQSQIQGEQQENVINNEDNSEPQPISTNFINRPIININDRKKKQTKKVDLNINQEYIQSNQQFQKTEEVSFNNQSNSLYDIFQKQDVPDLIVNNQRVPAKQFIKTIKSSDLYIDGQKVSPDLFLQALNDDTDYILNGLKDSDVLVNGKKFSSGTVANFEDVSAGATQQESVQQGEYQNLDTTQQNQQNNGQ